MLHSSLSSIVLDGPNSLPYLVSCTLRQALPMVPPIVPVTDTYILTTVNNTSRDIFAHVPRAPV